MTPQHQPAVAAMSAITRPYPIYEGLLLLATPEERDAIIRAGARENIDHNRAFGVEPAYRAAEAAYACILAIITRLKTEPTVRITGIDPRLMPPKRDTIEVEVVLTGRLMWEGRGGIDSRLLLEWSNPKVSIINLRIEHAEQLASTPLLSMSSSSRLNANERKNDTERLHEMQRLIDSGLPPKTAARRISATMPDPPTSEDSLATRLVRKFNNRRV